MTVLSYCQRVKEALNGEVVPCHRRKEWWWDRGAITRAEALAFEGFTDAAKRIADGVAERWSLEVD
jgi:hypothetical protein